MCIVDEVHIVLLCPHYAGVYARLLDVSSCSGLRELLKHLYQFIDARFVTTCLAEHESLPAKCWPLVLPCSVNEHTLVLSICCTSASNRSSTGICCICPTFSSSVKSCAFSALLPFLTCPCHMPLSHALLLLLHAPLPISYADSTFWNCLA